LPVGAAMVSPRIAIRPTLTEVPSRVGFSFAVCASCPAAQEDSTAAVASAPAAATTRTRRRTAASTVVSSALVNACR
jgi:hypothetical protein